MGSDKLFEKGNGLYEEGKYQKAFSIFMQGAKRVTYHVWFVSHLCTPVEKDANATTIEL